MDAAELIRDFESERPLAVRLAEAVSLAVLVDPPLLRRARRELVPEADPGTEADLWSSPLVQTRSVDGLVLIPEVAQELRQRLRDSGRLDPAWELTRNLHAHLSPALQMEEKIAWLSVSPGSAEEIEKLLRSVLAALVVGEQKGLAHWAARALPRLPSGVRDLGAARLLEAGSRLRLGGDARALDEEMAGDLSWITPADLPRVPVRVRLLVGTVELDAGATDGNVIQVPETDPLLMDLFWDEDGEETAVQVTLQRGGSIRIPILSSSVRLRTLLGEVYELHPEGRVGGRLRDWIIDFSEERERHRPFFGRQVELEEILLAIDQARESGKLVLVHGRLGEGKTALLGSLIDRLEQAGRRPLFHFFWRGMAEHLDAKRGLAAQVVTRFPDLETFVERVDFSELLYRAAERALQEEGKPLAIVLDAVDVAQGEGAPGEALLDLLPLRIPRGLVVVASARTENIEALSVPEAPSYVRLGDSMPSLAAFWDHYMPGLSERFGGKPVTPKEEAALRSVKNFGFARLAMAWFGTYWWPGDSLPAWRPLAFDAFWEEAQKRLGSQVLEPSLGILAAARQELSSTVLVRILGEATYRRFLEFPFLSTLHLPRETFHSLGDGNLRDFIAERLPLAFYHRQIAELVTEVLLSGEASELVREYSLRHAVSHWLAAGDRIEATRLVMNARYLTDKCREVGIAELRRDLIDCMAMGRQDPRLLADVSEVLHGAAALTRSEPADLPSILYAHLLTKGRQPDEARDILQLESDQPPLRPKPLGERRDSIVDRRHGSPVVGCRFLERPGTIPGILSWSSDGTLRFWEPDSGEMVHLLAEHAGDVTGVVLLGSSRLVTSSNDGTLRVWDYSERRLLKVLYGHEGAVLGVLGLNDRLAVSWSADRTIRIWDTEEGREVRALRGHEDAVTACSLRQDGFALLSGSRDMSVCQWAISSGVMIQAWKGNGSVTGLAVGEGFAISSSLDGSLCAWPLWIKPAFEPMAVHGHSLGVLSFAMSAGRVASWSFDQTIIVWDTDLGPSSSWRGLQRKAVLRGHTAAVLSCAFFPDGDRLVSASADGTLRIWDLETGETLHVLTGHAGPVRAVALDTEYISGLRGRIAEQIVSASDDRTLRIWNAESGEEMAVLDGDNETLHCIALQDRRRIVTWSRMGDLKIYHVDGNEPPGWLGSPGMAVGGALVTPDDRRLILWSRGLVQGQVQIAVWDLERGQEVASFRGPESPFLACAVTPDGSRLVVGSMVGGVGVWDLVEQHSVTWIPGHSGPITAIQMSQDGEWALTASWDGTLRILDLRKMTSLEMGVDHKDRVLSCAMNWGARAAVSASADRTLYLWRLEEGQGRRLTGHDDQVTACAFTRTDTRVVACSLDGTLAIWDALTGALLHRLRGHADWVDAFVIDDDRGVLYSCSEDKTVRAWDLESGEARGVVYGVSPFRSLALTYDGVAAGDEAGNFWALEYVGEGQRLQERILSGRFVRVEFTLERDLQVARLRDEWLAHEAEMYLCIESDLSDREILGRIETAKIGTSADLPLLKQRRLFGIDIELLKRTPDGLPAREDYRYFAITKEGPYWEAVARNREVAISEGDPRLRFRLYIILKPESHERRAAAPWPPQSA
jgi:WD40 repeat protein